MQRYVELDTIWCGHRSRTKKLVRGKGTDMEILHLRSAFKESRRTNQAFSSASKFFDEQEHLFSTTVNVDEILMYTLVEIQN